MQYIHTKSTTRLNPFLYTRCGIFLLFVLLLLSCKKEETNNSRPLEDGKSTVVYDLAGDTEASLSDGVDGKERRPFYIFLFQLSSRKQIWVRNSADSAQHLKTSNWDLAFTGNYNSELYLNNSTQSGNPGYEGPVTGTSIVLLQQAYEAVTTAPSDAEFDASTISKVGWTQSEDDPGWYRYDQSTHIMNAIRDRTYALRLPDGKYAKLQLLSVYKGNPPAVTDQYWPAPYLTFRYFVQQDGTKNLNTK